LDIIADESTLKSDMGEVLSIRSTDENIQNILYNLFYDILNIEFNLWPWVRNLCKYGDFFLKLEIAEIKPDITSPDKDDKTKYYKLISYHSQKPSHVEIEDITFVINQIKEIASKDNDIIEGKKRTENAIAEIDSLVNVAFEAGNSFKDKMNMPGNMMVMNDLYKSLNEILARKTTLKLELSGYQTENVIFKASPLVLNKKITMPTIIFVIGFAVWFLICVIWIGGVLVFGDEE
jgi:hypothetical protein